MKKYAQPSTWTQQEAAMFLAQLTRNQFVVGYVAGILSNLQEKTNLWKRDVKRRGKLVQEFINAYNNDVQKIMSVSGGFEEQILDASVAFRRNIKEPLFFLEQAFMRVCDKQRIPMTNDIVPLAVAKELVYLEGLINGIELHYTPRFEPTLSILGNKKKEQIKTEDRACEPNSFGTFLKILEKFNNELLHSLGVERVIFEGDDAEVQRALDISFTKIQTEFTNYKGFIHLYIVEEE